MNFKHYHFINTLRPSDILEFMKTLERFNEALKKVLYEEVSNGNKIVSVSTGWPSEESVSVALQDFFVEKVNSVGVAYTPIRDSHYGRAQYSTVQSDDSIFC